jgi:hypothetical protein
MKRWSQDIFLREIRRSPVGSQYIAASVWISVVCSTQCHSVPLSAGDDRALGASAGLLSA